MQGPAFSFRNIPWAIYVGVGLSLFCSFVYLVATLATVTEDKWQHYQALVRWRLLDDGGSTVSTILVPLGFLELARRHTGTARTLTVVGASLLFIHLSWLFLNIVVSLWNPDGSIEWFWTWSGRFVGVTALVAAILITIGADAWRRVLIAAIGVMLIHATSYWIPGVGPKISEEIGTNWVVRQTYSLVREGLASTCTLFIAAALAAGGRDVAPDPAAAVRGFLLARGALLARLIAALVLAMLTLGASNAKVGKLVAFGTPLVSIVTMVLFALGLQQVARARLPGMLRVLLVLGAALSLWWCSIQFNQVAQLVSSLRDNYSGERALEALQVFSIAGPIVATIGMVLPAIAILVYAQRIGRNDVAEGVLGRLIAFGIVMFINVGVIAAVFKTESVGTAIFLLLLGAGLAITGLVLLTMIFDLAARRLFAPPP